MNLSEDGDISYDMGEISVEKQYIPVGKLGFLNSGLRIGVESPLLMFISTFVNIFIKLSLYMKAFCLSHSVAAHVSLMLSFPTKKCMFSFNWLIDSCC